MGLMRKRRSVVGIDVQPTELRFIDLMRRKNDWSVLACGVQAIPDGLVEGVNIVDVAGVGEVLESTRRAARSQSRDAAIALPWQCIAMRTIHVDADTDDHDLEGLVALEAEAMELADAEVDFDVLGLSSEDASKLEVLIVACDRSPVLQRREVLEYAGYKPRAIEIDSFALGRSVEHHFGNRNGGRIGGLAVVDAAIHPGVLVMDDEGVIPRVLGDPGFGTAAGSGLEALSPSAFEAEAERIAATLAGYREPIKRVLTTAPAPMRSALHAALNVPVTELSPCADMTVLPSVDLAKLAEIEPKLAIACGLALGAQ